ncbi:MAG: nitroreductase family protein [Candidatus Saliniplasma sp.]
MKKVEKDHLKNSVINTMLDHKSIRSYKDEIPSDEEIESIVRAAQQAPFVSQLYSVILSREKDEHPFDAPLLFTICADFHKFEVIMKKRGWEPVTNDLSILFFALQDACYAAQNMVTAGESIGIGSCFLGAAPYKAKKLKEKYDIPDKVFPIVQLAMGYPDEDPSPRPRYPMEYVLFEEEYPELTDEMIESAMKEMDEGYLDQDYYRKLDAKLAVQGNEEDEYTYDDYSWTEHISRKWGQWYKDVEQLLEQLEKCGFDITREE